MECRKIAELIPLAVGGELVPAVVERVCRHIEACSGCRALWDSQMAAFHALQTVFACEKGEMEGNGSSVAMAREVLDMLEMGCALASRLAPLAAGGELPVPTARRLQWHCEQCPKCREEMRRYVSLRDVCAAVGSSGSSAFDDGAAFWADLELQLEREAIFAACEAPGVGLPGKTRRLSAVGFWAAAAALLLFGLFAGFQFGSDRLFMRSEAGRGDTVREEANEEKDTDVAVIPPSGENRIESHAPDDVATLNGLAASIGVSDRFPRMTPVGASNVPFVLGSLHGEKKWRVNAIQVILLLPGTSDGYEIQQIRIIPQDNKRPRKF
jgi:anti-sigma factor RsiW